MTRPPDETGPRVGPRAGSKVIATTVPIVSQTDPSRPDVAAATEDAAAAPCRRCGHTLTAPRSVARGIGPVCVHLTRGEAS
ncbi:DUF6011 domain-containing protein [Fodinibacter luteus]|uniref:DUF6011 domain-containing protein n=1 Tax=Fodinibacter luteus TaxID=552064 RepID=UPI003CCC5C5A